MKLKECVIKNFILNMEIFKKNYNKSLFFKYMIDISENEIKKKLIICVLKIISLLKFQK